MTEMNDFLEMLVVEKLATLNTIESYKRDICHLTEFFKLKFNNDLLWSEINYDHLVLYISYLYEKELAISSIARKISVIRMFFSFLFTEGFITSNPSSKISLPKKQKTLPKSLSQHDISQLLSSMSKYDDPRGLRNLAMMELLYGTGIRVSELITITIDRIQYAIANRDHKLIIEGKGKKERIVLLNDNSLQAVNNYLKVRHLIYEGLNLTKVPWLFHSLNKKNQVVYLSRQRCFQILRDFNLKMQNFKISPHRIRHSFATHMLKNGANIKVIQELLGHASISSTQIYTKVANDYMEKELLAKHPLVQKEI